MQEEAGSTLLYVVLPKIEPDLHQASTFKYRLQEVGDTLLQMLLVSFPDPINLLAAGSLGC